MKSRTLSLLIAFGMLAASCGGADEPTISQENLEGFLEAASTGSATGIINVLGVDYIFNSGTCFVDSTGFDASGPGETADGVPFWGSVSSSIETREGMEEAGLPQANIDAFFGGKDSLETLTVSVELGKADRFSSGEDGMADLSIDLIDAGSSNAVSYRIEGGKLSGSGQISDWNGVLIPFGETAAASFSATCG